MKRCMMLAIVLVAAVAVRDGIAEEPPAGGATCELDWVVQTARTGLSQGSAAYQKYLRALIKEAALTMPIDALRVAVEQEADPAVLEALGAALATRASYDEDPTLLQVLLERAARDGDPALRAAAIRGLRATGSVEAMASFEDALGYEALVRDPSPEVRAAVAANLVAENEEVYGGRDARVADTAARVAMASPDPAVAAQLLSSISMEQASRETVAQLRETLAAADPQLRAGAALALGGAPPDAGTPQALVAQFHRERDVDVRKAILHALARHGQATAVPMLTSLRGAGTVLDAEIDAWIAALGLGLQEWHLIVREKLRRTSPQ
jgi:HEAT repeat protein